ncbi:hypothetical protein [Alkaliphilus transvaalensis]|uniref:hypothetical protein n=1 Tax=Alkaliphilus transvaalensis TaxID=114628 RepID=UPI000479BC93|nr:hypothetical protein [Alkaliphilus transvaalensis]
MKDKRWFIVVVIVLCILVGLGLWQFQTIEEIQVAHQESYEISQWERATGIFDTDSSQPLLYYRDGDYAIYIQSNQLLYKNFGKEPQVIYTWDKPSKGKIWKSDGALLVGTEPEEEGSWTGKWFAVRLPNEDHPQFKLFPFKEMQFFGPHQIISMGISNDPSIFVATVKNATTYTEMIYKLGESDFIWVNHLIHPKINGEEKNIEMPAIVRQPMELKLKAFQLENTTFFTFEDDRGTIIYYEEDNKADRYVDFKFYDLKKWLF